MREPQPQQQFLTFQQGISCKGSFQVHPDTALGGRAGVPGCLGGMSGQWGRECLEKQREKIISSWETPHLLPARAQNDSYSLHISVVEEMGYVIHGASDV